VFPLKSVAGARGVELPIDDADPQPPERQLPGDVLTDETLAVASLAEQADRQVLVHRDAMNVQPVRVVGG